MKVRLLQFAGLAMVGLFSSFSLYGQDPAPPAEPAKQEAAPAAATPAPATPAQETPAPAVQPTPADGATPPATASGSLELDALLQKFSDLGLQCDAKEIDFKKAGESLDPEKAKADKARIKTEYELLVAEMDALLVNIRTEAIKAYNANPNKDEKIIKTLFGLMINDANAGRDWEAFSLAEPMISNKTDMAYFEKALAAKRLSFFGRDIVQEVLKRRKDAEAGDLPLVKITTEKGEMVLELFENDAPNTVANFVSLIESKFYDGLTFHRVLKDFMAQGGCPKGTGEGGPGYRIKREINATDFRRHFTGSLAMARSQDPDSAGCQFYICYERRVNLDREYTVFGRLVSGKDAHDAITARNPELEKQPAADKIVKIEVIRKRPHEYKPETLPEPTPATPAGEKKEEEKK